MQSVGAILQSSKLKKQIENQLSLNIDELKSAGFVRFPLELFDSLLFTHKLTKRQILIILMIIRFSIGCRRPVAILKPTDFQLVGIHLSDIVRELETLSKLNFIGWDRGNEKMWITKKLLGELPTKDQRKVGKLLTTNLAKYQHTTRSFTNKDDAETHGNKSKSRTDRYRKININSSNRYRL
jgi:hypothetical protein